MAKAQGSLDRRVVAVGVVDVNLSKGRLLAVPGAEWSNAVIQPALYDH